MKMRDYKNSKVSEPLTASELLAGVAFCIGFCGLIFFLLVI